jgi:hypothetical protein
MREVNTRNTISTIITGFCSEIPDWKNLIRSVTELDREIRRENLNKKVTPGYNVSYMNKKAADVRCELDSLKKALLANDVQKSLEHAEAVLQIIR